MDDENIVGGRPGPGSALGPPPSRQRPPWGCWAWWWWLGGVEPPVTGLYTLVIPEFVPHVGSPCPVFVPTHPPQTPNPGFYLTALAKKLRLPVD